MENNSRNNGAVKKQQVINYGFGVQAVLVSGYLQNNN